MWSGSAYVEVFPSQSLLDTYQLRSEKGVSNGYASLDVNGKVPIGQLPNSIMEYKGTWSAATNTPTLANGTGDTGDVYLCNAAGTVNFGAGPITFAVGDYVVYSGSIYQRSSGAVGTVTSVAASITGDSITISGSPISTSGTLAFAFGGNSTQYINGAGNLVTFPGIINEAQNLITEVYNKTGATLTKGTVVYINSPGGSVMCGLGIVDLMNYVSSDIVTTNLGMCASMGSVLLSSGTKGKRSSLIHSKVMTHQVSHGTRGNIQDTRIDQMEGEKYNYILFKILAENCGKTFQEVLDTFILGAQI